MRRMTVAKLLALGLALVAPATTEAQAALLGRGAAFLAGGVSRIATGELDDRLAARGYPTFGRTAGAVGLGAYRILGSGLMLGFEGNGLILGEEPHGEREVGLGAGYATLGLGWAIEPSLRQRIYPRLGVGVGGLGLWIESDEGPVDFDEVLEDPEPFREPREPVLSRAGPVVDLGAGVELLPGDGAGLLIGLRFGWLLAPFASDWDLYEREVRGGPDASISGPYLRVLLGGAWRR